MLLLTDTTHKLQLVTGAAGGSVDVQVNFADKDAAGAVDVGDKEVFGITTATTTDICDPPGAGVKRNIRSAYITNTHASVSVPVIILKTTSGGSADIIGVTLGPGENLNLLETGQWRHLDKEGAEYTPAASMVDLYGAFGIAGAWAESIPRMLCNEANLAFATTGVLFLQAIYLRAGQTVSSISFMTGGTALASGTNQFFALYDASRQLVGQTANFTTEAWAANTLKTKALSTPYKVPVSGIYYVGIMLAAGTMPTLKGLTAKTASQLAGQAPILHGTSNTGLTTTLPATANAITVTANAVWAAVS